MPYFFISAIFGNEWIIFSWAEKNRQYTIAVLEGGGNLEVHKGPIPFWIMAWFSMKTEVSLYFESQDKSNESYVTVHSEWQTWICDITVSLRGHAQS